MCFTSWSYHAAATETPASSMLSTTERREHLSPQGGPVESARVGRRLKEAEAVG